mmetsp:Transcript_182284/g.443686  ORF Transcript_182284/g.443686 Transcript_182284/m.443686 type:complete len:240 (+) Transcript_182284:218-937(+)
MAHEDIQKKKERKGGRKLRPRLRALKTLPRASLFGIGTVLLTFLHLLSFLCRVGLAFLSPLVSIAILASSRRSLRLRSLGLFALLCCAGFVLRGFGHDRLGLGCVDYGRAHKLDRLALLPQRGNGQHGISTFGLLGLLGLFGIKPRHRLVAFFYDLAALLVCQVLVLFRVGRVGVCHNVLVLLNRRHQFCDRSVPAVELHLALFELVAPFLQLCQAFQKSFFDPVIPFIRVEPLLLCRE